MHFKLNLNAQLEISISLLRAYQKKASNRWWKFFPFYGCVVCSSLFLSPEIKVKSRPYLFLQLPHTWSGITRLWVPTKYILYFYSIIPNWIWIRGLKLNQITWSGITRLWETGCPSDFNTGFTGFWCFTSNTRVCPFNIKNFESVEYRTRARN